MPAAARNRRPETPNRRQWLEDRLVELGSRGKSKSGLSRALLLHPTRVSEMITGKRSIDSTELRPLADYLEWPVEHVLGLVDRGGPSVRPTVPIVGYVGAGALVVPFDDVTKLDRAEAPPTVAPTTVAVIVRGDSMYPVCRDGDLIYYDQQPEPPDRHLKRECVVRLADGRILVRVLGRGSIEGRYTLLSYNGTPEEDVEIDWAVPVRWIRRSGA
ncbi:MAG: helix-turn-helix transcriptional regulator [Alphaproteobacteria bacterium]